LPKLRLLGASPTPGAGVTPVPLRETLCGLPVALSLILTLALRLPEAVGLNVTVMVQLAAAARLLGQVLVWAKSLELVPARAILFMVSVAVPVLVRVMPCPALVVPTF
jgi:hypothetical protein